MKINLAHYPTGTFFVDKDDNAAIIGVDSNGCRIVTYLDSSKDIDKTWVTKIPKNLIDVKEVELPEYVLE